jgi:hypothetical protein
MKATTSIQSRLRTAITVGMLLPSIVLFIALYMLARAQYVEFFEQALRDDLRTIANVAQVHPNDDVYVNIEPEALPQYLADGTRFFQVWETPSLELVDRSGSLERLGATLAHPQAITQTPRRYEAALPDGRALSLIVFQSRANWAMDRETLERTGLTIKEHELHVVVGRLRAELDVPLRWLALACFAGAFLVPLLAGLAAAAVAPRALSPLERLGDALARRAASSVEPLAQDDVREVRAVSVAFDQLLQRIAHSREREREGVAEVARELRAAVAELQSSADVALLLPGHALGAVSRMQGVSQRISGLVGVLPQPGKDVDITPC